MSLQRPGSADVEQLSEKDEREAAPIIDSFDLTVVSYYTALPPHIHLTILFQSALAFCQKIRRIRRSLDAESAKTLVHAFITSRIDSCNTVLAGSPRTITDRLERRSPCRQ